MPYKAGTQGFGAPSLEHVDADLRVSLNPPSLESRIHYLKNHPSPDPLQRMQSQAIIELYEVVKQLQMAVAGIVPLPLPNVSAVREAAAKAAEGRLKRSIEKP